MKKVNLTIYWILGILFLIIGIDAISESFLGGLSFILISLLLLPPARTLDFLVLKKEIPHWARNLAIFLLIITFGVFMTHSKKLKSQELQVQLAEAKQIQSSPKRNSNKGSYTKVVSTSEKYPPITNSDNTARPNSADIKYILNKLRTIPASQYEKNRNYYRQLVSLSPYELKYQEKLDYYTEMVTKYNDTSSSCDSILKQNKFISTPKWLSSNRHCLSQTQKNRIEKILLTKVRKLPAEKAKENRDGYKALSILNPNNKSYLRKLKKYESTVRLMVSSNT